MIEPLLDRRDELARLEAAWAGAAAGNPQLVVVWGRRRVGKTFLLSHFARERRSIFFPATRQAEPVELRRFRDSLRRDLGERFGDLAGTFESWEAALRFSAALAADEPLCLVIDEAPYLSESTKGFTSIVQAFWDHLPSGTKLLVALTGSAVGSVETMLGPGGSLRGRPTLAARLDPLDPWQARVFLPDLPPADFLEAFAACGGYPLHLKSWDPAAGTEDNLLRLAASPGGILLEDAAGMLAEELPDASGYARVLAAIGRGRTRYSEIAGEANQRIEHPLGVLVRSAFVERAVPVGAPAAGKGVYELADPYLAFWFRVLYPRVGLIEAGQGRAVLADVEARWRDHLGRSFERCAVLHARRLVAAGRLPEGLLVGRWWSTRGEACEVDVLGLRRGRTHLLGEARWQARPLGRSDVGRLRAKLARVPSPAEPCTLALWGRSGVDADALRPDVLGFDAAGLLGED